MVQGLEGCCWLVKADSGLFKRMCNREGLFSSSFGKRWLQNPIGTGGLWWQLGWDKNAVLGFWTTKKNPAEFTRCLLLVYLWLWWCSIQVSFLTFQKAMLRQKNTPATPLVLWKGVLQFLYCVPGDHACLSSEKSVIFHYWLWTLLWRLPDNTFTCSS